MRANLSQDRLLAALAVAAILMTGEVASAQQGLGPAFPVNTLAQSFTRPRADVATAPGGEFMVVWVSPNSAGSDSDGTSVQAQRFDAAGVMSGGQFQVNTATAGNQNQAEVAIDGSGAARWTPRNCPNNARRSRRLPRLPFGWPGTAPALRRRPRSAAAGRSRGAGYRRDGAAER